LDAIAREADIAKPVVYNAYPGRAALLEALLEREERRGLKALADAMPPAPIGARPAELLLAWLQSLAEAIAASPASWRLILLPPDGTPVEVRERVERGRRFALAQAQTLIRALLEVRLPDVPLDPELAAQSLFAICERVAGLMLEDPARYPPERVLEYAQALLEVLGLR
jgi:AcrR family transcriptional regulator